LIRESIVQPQKIGPSDYYHLETKPYKNDSSSGEDSIFHVDSKPSVPSFRYLHPLLDV